MSNQQEVHDPSECKAGIPGPWWPFPSMELGSSLEVHMHRLSVDFGVKREDGDITHSAPPSRLSKVRPRGYSDRLLSACDIGKEMPQRLLQDINPAPPPPLQEAFLYPQPQGVKGRQQRTRRMRPGLPRRRTTSYENFKEETFGEKQPPCLANVGRQESLLSLELNGDEDCASSDQEQLASMKTFRFPGTLETNKLV